MESLVSGISWKKIATILTRDDYHYFLNKYTLDSPRRQKFSMPSSLLFYVLRNPASFQCLIKIYQSCKYFPSKHQILISATNTCYNGTNITSYHDSRMYPVIKNFYAFWLSGCLTIENHNSLMLQKIYRCSVSSLIIYDSTIAFTDFDLLIAENTIKRFSLNLSTIKFPHGSNVPIFVILEKLSNAVSITYSNPEEIFTPETLEILNKIKRKNVIDFFKLKVHLRSEMLNLEILRTFIRNNSPEDIDYKFNLQMSSFEAVKIYE